MTAILRHRITPAEFVRKWRPVTLTERATAQEHFIDLCRLFDHPTPVEDDPTGEQFTFEKGVHKAGGGDGFADVWKRGFFAWEYKKRKRNLDEALGQLSRYALALENPPLQIVCDTERFRIVTAYTNSVPRSYDLSLDELLDNEKRAWLEWAFHSPSKLKTGAKRADLTQKAADRFSKLAIRLQAKGHSTEEVGHFINRLVFLFFAEDVGILKENFFRRTIGELAGRPSEARDLLTDLFKTCKKGGRFGLDRLPHINGGLFDDREALDLDEHEIGLLKAASSQDWGHIDPTVFGILFERFLDPDKRSQIGAHYTDAKKIGQVINPVILDPLIEEWEDLRADIEALVVSARKKGNKSKDWQRAEDIRTHFLERLRTLSILDPACGSGNFLYLALRLVKDLEHRTNQECEALGLSARMPIVGPEILRGIEINSLAAELARTTVWIGDIQWAIQNGIHSRSEPILRRLDMIECRDAILKKAGEKAEWPKAEFIVGNPPFLGAKLLKEKLGSGYVQGLRSAYDKTLPGTANLVCYWFDKAADAIENGDSSRVGFVATTTIKQPGSIAAVNRLQKLCDIHDVKSDEPWTLDGAAVRVSIICASKSMRNSLPSDQEVADAAARVMGRSHNFLPRKIADNSDICFEGFALAGSFNLPGDAARKMLKKRGNLNKKQNAQVIRPLRNGRDIVGRLRDEFVIDFARMELGEACLYEAPFRHVEEHVKPERMNNNRESRRLRWWQFGETRPGLRKSTSDLSRQLCILKTSKFRLFVWMPQICACDGSVNVIARDDDVIFGALQNKYHDAWSLMMGGRLEDRPRYTPTTTFETFPFAADPHPSRQKQLAKRNLKAEKVANASKKLSEMREEWLNHPDYVRVEPDVVPGFPDRFIARDADAAVELSKRTLTNLYNERPMWLDNAHRELDAAVAAAYGWPEDISTEDALTGR